MNLYRLFESRFSHERHVRARNAEEAVRKWIETHYIEKYVLKCEGAMFVVTFPNERYTPYCILTQKIADYID